MPELLDIEEAAVVAGPFAGLVVELRFPDESVEDDETSAFCGALMSDPEGNYHLLLGSTSWVG